MSFSPNDNFWLNITQGLVEKYSEIHKFGTSENVGTSFVPIARGNVYQTPTTAQALEIVSADVNDTVAGTGARTVIIEGLDSSFAFLSQEVNMNGTTAVALPTNLIRAFRMKVGDSGTYATATVGSHAGELTLQGTGGGVLWLSIPVTDFPRGQTQCGVASVATGKSCVVYPHYLSVDANKAADIIFFTREGIDVVAAPFTAMKAGLELVGVTGFDLAIDVAAPQGPFVGPCDIGYMGKFGSGTGSISADFEIIQYNT